MPRNIRGTGTIFFGKTDQRPDGSFVTTEWFVFFLLPVLPLRSRRITADGADKFLWSLVQRYQFRVIEEVPLAWRQVLVTYVIGWGLLLWSAFVVTRYDEIVDFVGPGNDVLVVFPVLLAPFIFLLVYGWARQYRH